MFGGAGYTAREGETKIRVEARAACGEEAWRVPTEGRRKLKRVGRASISARRAATQLWLGPPPEEQWLSSKGPTYSLVHGGVVGLAAEDWCRTPACAWFYSEHQLHGDVRGRGGVQVSRRCCPLPTTWRGWFHCIFLPSLPPPIPLLLFARSLAQADVAWRYHQRVLLLIDISAKSIVEYT